MPRKKRSRPEPKAMGKAATEATGGMKRKKKKGRPPKNSLPLLAPPKTINYDSVPTSSRGSTRRNPKNFNSPPPEFVDDDDDDDGDDDDDERKEKKVKLVVRLPSSDEHNKVNQKKQQQQQNKRHSPDNDSASGSGSESDPESDDDEAYAKKLKINAVDLGSENAASFQVRYFAKKKKKKKIPQNLTRIGFVVLLKFPSTVTRILVTLFKSDFPIPWVLFCGCDLKGFLGLRAKRKNYILFSLGCSDF